MARQSASPLDRSPGLSRTALASVVACLALGLAAGCGTSQPFVWAADIPISTPIGEPVIQARDTILVHAGSQKEISGEFIVRDDGQYLQPPIGNVMAAGRTPSQLSQEVSRRLQGMITNTTIAVSIPKRAPIKVHVIGAVRTPASYELDRDRSIVAALAAAGWLNDYAKDDGIFVVRPKDQPPRIRFRSKDLKVAEPHSALFQLRDGDVLVVE